MTSTKPGAPPSRPGVAAPHRSFLASIPRPLIAIVAVVAVAVAAAAFLLRPQAASQASAPFVGGDLHAVAVIDGRRFVSGHEGAGFSDTSGTWTRIGSLDAKDAMAWTQTSAGLLVGGHEGLWVSFDGGETFDRAPADLSVTDVHALGASGETVYLASPAGGLFVSTDAGLSFRFRSQAGSSFMGTMLVDPRDASHVVATDMAAGVVESRDGGRTWRSLGGPMGAMSVAWDPSDQSRMVAVGMEGAVVSSDSGADWQPLKMPDGSAAVTIDDRGRIVVGALVGDQAHVYVSSDDGASWIPV